MLLSSLLLLGGAIGALAADDDIRVSFRPQDLPKKVTTCKALNRATETDVDIDIRKYLT